MYFYVEFYRDSKFENKNLKILSGLKDLLKILK